MRHAELASDNSVHLIVDLGSSGTRFCLYEVRTPSELGQNRCTLADSKPVCIRVKGGFAKLTKGRHVSDVPRIVRPRLRVAWALLGDPAHGGAPVLRSRVRAAAALGTGGFRDSETGQPMNRPEWQALFTEIKEFLSDEVGVAVVTAFPITGEEEGRFAWLGVAQTSPRPEEFATIEAGGATVQLAVGSFKATGAEVQVATDPLGQDAVFERLASGASKTSAAAASTNGFEVCHHPQNPRVQDGIRCINLLGRLVFQDSAVSRLAEKTHPRRLFGLGLSFGDLFRSYPAAPPWLRKQDRLMHKKLDLDHIRELTALLCPLTDVEIAAYAPRALAIQGEGGIEKAQTAGRACYYLAYRAALLSAIRTVALNGELYSVDDEQWPRGAAISGDLFTMCR